MLRLAGTGLNAAKNFLFKGMKGGDIVARVTPDFLFGGLEAAMTPGDIGDKVIAGTGSALGGSLGGLALGRLGGNNQALGLVLDMAGSIGGDFAGRAGADLVMRGKDKVIGSGRGLTPYERMTEEQQLQFAEQIKAQTLADLGLLPGGTQSYLIDQGLA